MDELKKQAEELGIKVDARWGEDRLRAEIEKVLAEQAEAEAAKKAEADALAARLAAEEEARLAAEAEAERIAKEGRDLAGAEEAARLAAEVEAAEKARQEAEEAARLEEEAAASVRTWSITVTNLRPNPMKALGLASYGNREFTEAELTNPRLMAKIKRGQELGILKVE